MMNQVPIRKAQCKTCPFRSDGWTEVRALLERRALTEATPICHSTGRALVRHNGEKLKAHLCRGARNYQLTIFYRLGVIAAPTDEAWKEKLDHMEKEKSFQVGDTVTWTSQAGGKSKTKTGKVVIIVPAGKLLGEIPLGGFRFRHLTLFSSRDHESYLVQVGKSRRLYWPLVKNLKRVEVVETGRDVYDLGIRHIDELTDEQRSQLS